MAVFGGRSRWASTLLGGVTFGAGAVVAFAGCGSRTSMLDQDIYVSAAGTPNAGGGGHSGNVAGANSKGGSTGVVHAGSGGGGTGPGTGTAGTAGVGGKASGGVVDPGLAIAPCDKYCPGYGTQCVARLKGAECVPTCQGELNGFGKSCQSLGIKAINCLTPFFTPGGSNCDAAVGRALNKCKSIVDKFNACKKKAGGSNTPGTAPDFDPTMCTLGDHYADPQNCLYSYVCDSGTYVAACTTNASNTTADCTCINPDGSQQQRMVKVQGALPACDTASDACF